MAVATVTGGENQPAATQNPWLALAQSVLMRGIDAYAETQQVRYRANDPVAQNRGDSLISAPEGSPAFDTLRATFTTPSNLVLLGVVAVLVVVLIKRL